MAFRIYKPGQGYWIRVMTAAMIGVLTLSMAAWAWGQGLSFAESLPKSRWSVTVSELAEAPAPGTPAVVETRSRDGSYMVVAEGIVSNADAPNNRVFLSGVKEDDAIDFGKLDYVRIGSGDEAPRFIIEQTPERSAAIEPMFLQGGLAAVVLLVGSFFAYWVVGTKPKAVEFLIATDMEMKKVNWSTRREIIRSTNVVILVSVLLAVFLFAVDRAFIWIFQAMDVLVK